MIRTERDYQVSIRKNTGRQMLRDKWVLVQSPTGSGKSFIMFNMISNGLRKGKTFLVLTESKKIFDQLSNEFDAYRINARTKYFAMRKNNVYVAMSQSLANRDRIIQSFLDLGDQLIVMIDEAHIGTTKEVIKVFPGNRIGFTATPAYRWAKFLPDLYKSIVVGPQVEELIQKGALSPYRHIGRKKVDSSKLKTNKSTGEYTEASQERAFGTSQVFDGLYEDLRAIKYKCGMIYVASIKQCEEVHAKLIEHGFVCAISHSKRADNDDQMKRYHDDPDCNLMVSVAGLTKGYDNPIIDLVVLFRATTSLPLYLQMAGRGGRVLKPNDLVNYRSRNSCPELQEKLFFTVLDYGLNFDRFGAWDSDRPWEELWLATPVRDKEAAPVKECPMCESYVPTSAVRCKWCGYIWPVEKKQLAIGDLIDFNETATKLLGRRVGELSPEELADYAKSKNAANRAIRIAKARRQVEKWKQTWAVKYDGLDDGLIGKNYLKDFGKAMGYKDNWFGVATGDIKRHESLAKEKALKIAEEKAGHEIDPKGFYFDYTKAEIKFDNYILA